MGEEVSEGSERAAIEAYDLLAEIYDTAVPDPIGFTAFYRDACADANAVLYVGCGTGRLLASIAHLGVDLVVGVDPSKEMLRRARERLSGATSPASTVDVEIIVDQLPELSTQAGRRFDRIIVAGGAFEYLLTTRDQIAALRRMRQLLASDGILLIDVAAPPFATTVPRGNYAGEEFSAVGSAEGSHSSRYPSVVSSEVHLAYDHFYQILESRCTFSLVGHNEPFTVTYRTRYTMLAEWRMLLVLAGLGGEIFGGFARQPVTRTSSNFVLEVQRR